jgi:hypothetical protein
MKVRFPYYMHDDCMTSEVVENIEYELPDDIDIELVASKVKDFCYEVKLTMEFDTNTNELTIVGVE